MLGWTINGTNQSITLPIEKQDHPCNELSSIIKYHFMSIKQLQKCQGQLMHAAFGIPNGKGLLSPIIAMVAKHADHLRKLLKIIKSLCQAFSIIFLSSMVLLNLCLIVGLNTF